MDDNMRSKKLASEDLRECSLSKKQKENCSYGDKCYRQKPDHFKEYGHPHLEELLRKIGETEIGIPANYTAKVSTQTLIEQLAIMKKINDSFKPNNKTSSISLCDNKDAKGNSSISKEDREKLFEHRVTKGSTNTKDCKGSPYKNKESQEGPSTSNVKENSSERQDEIVSSSSKKVELDKAAKDKLVENMKQARNYRVVVWDRSKHKVSEKLKAAEPYSVFLTVITDSAPTHSEMLSIQIPELLDPTLGDLESSLQINFMVQFGWLLAQYHIMGHNRKPMTLLYGQVDEELDMFKHFLTHVKVKPPSPFGSHHTKMMIFSYKDGSIRVVVCTANLVESDWDNRTQGLWISPSCPKLPFEADTGAGESVTFFKRDLVKYLSAYQLPHLQQWIGKVKRADFSAVKVIFIGSVPGSHTTERNNWGQLALATALNKNIKVPDKNSYKVIVQCSSIGSLGPKPESWLMGEMLQTFCSGKKDGPVSRPNLHFIYPSFENVASSHDGLLGGGCLPYSRKTHAKQEWLTSFMCQWKSDSRHRTKASPHIKSYCRVSNDHSKMSYFLLTSANMSRAAWGSQTKAGSLTILSYEAGVLFLPQFVIDKEYFPLKKTDESDNIPVFPLPYDLPVTPYNFSDVPWFIENLC